MNEMSSTNFGGTSNSFSDSGTPSTSPSSNHPRAPALLFQDLSIFSNDASIISSNSSDPTIIHDNDDDVLPSDSEQTVNFACISNEIFSVESVSSLSPLQLNFPITSITPTIFPPVLLVIV
ncbi:unnamed protein product [Trichobilharzia regenti]|uniref:Uncharacterized protein n=1 Tax=Trichobilharzia regenti TaxID=157069 RepID=A0A183WTP1_TRIRE|nr:unnamed protein product [Trichobilharzia regenti]VDQ11374.1 unnamed protein product [Trichobilharzia regenti]